MRKIVVDSDVVIDYLRARRGVFVSLANLMRKGEAKLFVSTITVVELYATDNESQKLTVGGILDEMEIVDLDKELAMEVGEAKSRLGKVVGLADLIIGVSSIMLGAELATRNKKHFEKIPGLRFWKG